MNSNNKLIYLLICLLLPTILFSQNDSTKLCFKFNEIKPFKPKIVPSYNTISLTAVGDLQMGASCTPVIKKKGYCYPFDSTEMIIKKADIAIANLEAPFAEKGRPFNKTFTFKVPFDFLQGPLAAGFDIFTLANNHILDYGNQGLFTTLHALDSVGIKHCGAGKDLADAEKPCIINYGKWRIGFLAFSLTYPAEFWAYKNKPGTAYPNIQRIKKILNNLKENTNLIVVSFHWGGELKKFPKPYQILYAHQVIDYGADIVLGHHPHILQGLEFYKGKLIAYSLGNYVFGSYSRNVKYSMILKLRYDCKGFLLAEVIPIYVYNPEVNFQPVILRGEDKMKVIKELNRISRKFNKGKNIISKTGLIVNIE